MEFRGEMEQLRLCSSCGQGPRGKPMLRCSRCKSVWYHDIECQRKGWRRHKKVCKRIAEENTQCHSTCCNADVTGTSKVELDRDITGHVIPEWGIAPGKERTTRLTYRDERKDNPIEVIGSDSSTAGHLQTVTLDFHPIPVDKVPVIAPSEETIVAFDSDEDMFTREESTAMCLNAFHIRCFLQKEDQLKRNKFDLLIEFDVRENLSGSTLCLVVTTLKDGLEDIDIEVANVSHSITTSRRRFHFYAPRKLPAIICDAMSPVPTWDIVQGLLPMGIDYILTSPFYKMWMDAAAQAGRTVEIKLYCRSPILAPAGSPQTTDEQMTKVVKWIQSIMQGYKYAVHLIRLPDGITGDEEYPIETMRRLEEQHKFVGQPLLEKEEERCVPQETCSPEAFLVYLDNVTIRPKA